ncbi:MAG: S-methyl-5'-thioadenosine phosphorylase [archaeon]
MEKAEIAIIGGTGVYDPGMLKNSKEIAVKTKYGEPSDKITIGEFQGKQIAFLPRHGKKHTIPPHSINFRANIDALKQLGVTHILAPQAVGGMKEETKPGDIVICDQFIDRTWGRQKTFYDHGQVCHISMADPFCPELRNTLIEQCNALEYSHHPKGTYICVQGPRFSTRAESLLYRQWGCDVIGMTLVPECILAREAQICYASIATVTDYDCWKEGAVTLEEVIKTMKESEEKVKKLLAEVIPKISKERKCGCKSALDGSLI